eukprot:Hpha_TRINITY_DN16537_c0_g1::TRINITY_DN16537_c0_g1_i1::g.136504::m.136504
MPHNTTRLLVTRTTPNTKQEKQERREQTREQAEEQKDAVHAEEAARRRVDQGEVTSRRILLEDEGEERERAGARAIERTEAAQREKITIEETEAVRLVLDEVREARAEASRTQQFRERREAREMEHIIEDEAGPRRMLAAEQPPAWRRLAVLARSAEEGCRRRALERDAAAERVRLSEAAARGGEAAAERQRAREMSDLARVHSVERAEYEEEQTQDRGVVEQAELLARGELHAAAVREHELARRAQSARVRAEGQRAAVWGEAQAVLQSTEAVEERERSHLEAAAAAGRKGAGEATAEREQQELIAEEGAARRGTAEQAAGALLDLTPLRNQSREVALEASTRRRISGEEREARAAARRTAEESALSALTSEERAARRKLLAGEVGSWRRIEEMREESLDECERVAAGRGPQWEEGDEDALPPVEEEGFLHRRRKGRWGAWDRVYGVLRGGVLRLYQPQSQLDLGEGGASGFLPGDTSGTAFTASARAAGKVHDTAVVLMAPTRENASRWVAALTGDTKWTEGAAQTTSTGDPLEDPQLLTALADMRRHVVAEVQRREEERMKNIFPELEHTRASEDSRIAELKARAEKQAADARASEELVLSKLRGEGEMEGLCSKVEELRKWATMQENAERAVAEAEEKAVAAERQASELATRCADMETTVELAAVRERDAARLAAAARAAARQPHLAAGLLRSALEAYADPDTDEQVSPRPARPVERTERVRLLATAQEEEARAAVYDEAARAAALAFAVEHATVTLEKGDQVHAGQSLRQALSMWRGPADGSWPSSPRAAAAFPEYFGGESVDNVESEAESPSALRARVRELEEIAALAAQLETDLTTADARIEALETELVELRRDGSTQGGTQPRRASPRATTRAGSPWRSRFSPQSSPRLSPRSPGRVNPRPIPSLGEDAATGVAKIVDLFRQAAVAEAEPQAQAVVEKANAEAMLRRQQRSVELEELSKAQEETAHTLDAQTERLLRSAEEEARKRKEWAEQEVEDLARAKANARKWAPPTATEAPATEEVLVVEENTTAPTAHASEEGAAAELRRARAENAILRARLRELELRAVPAAPSALVPLAVTSNQPMTSEESITRARVEGTAEGWFECAEKWDQSGRAAARQFADLRRRIKETGELRQIVERLRDDSPAKRASPGRRLDLATDAHRQFGGFDSVRPQARALFAQEYLTRGVRATRAPISPPPPDSPKATGLRALEPPLWRSPYGKDSKALSPGRPTPRTSRVAS